MSVQPAYAVELRGIAKSFGENRANEDVSLRVRPGTIHAIIGENGAGKSTAMKILFGLQTPDAGQMLIDGVERRWRSPHDAIAAGLGMVQQHFLLAGPLSALDNLLLGVESERARRAGWLASFFPAERRRARERLSRLAGEFGLEVDLDSPAEQLPVAAQQRIEILKLLDRDARILILDEPTAVLTPLECEAFFANLRKLARGGRTILIITHKLKEVMALAHEVTVFRAGRVVGERQIAQTDAGELAELMIGHKLPPQAVPPSSVDPRSAPLLTLENVRLARDGVEVLRGLNLQVHAGEIVGIAGVQGNGQSEIPRLVRDAVDHAAFVPEDRQHQGLLLDRPCWENFLLGLERTPEFSWGGIVLRRARAMETFREQAKRFEIRGARADLPVRGLSGGNQQKLICARELYRAPKLLVASEPTRGVDLGAIRFLHDRLLEARARGLGVLLISSDLDEVLALSDRILVMSHGAIVREFGRGEADERSLGAAMGGIA